MPHQQRPTSARTPSAAPSAARSSTNASTRSSAGGKHDQPHQDPQRSEPRVSTTPFARVLTAFMWSKQPPWSAAKTAAVLGMGRARVSNWIYGDVEPELGTMMDVMHKLNIPVRLLIEAYDEQGQPTPQQMSSAERAGSGTGATTTARGVGADEQTLAAMEARLASKQPQPQPQTQAQPEEAATAAAAAAEAEEAERTRREWEIMMEHTRTVMRLAGFPDSTISAMLAEAAARALGAPSPQERAIAEELSPGSQRTPKSEKKDDGDQRPTSAHGNGGATSA